MLVVHWTWTQHAPPTGRRKTRVKGQKAERKRWMKRRRRGDRVQEVSTQVGSKHNDSGLTWRDTTERHFWVNVQWARWSLTTDMLYFIIPFIVWWGHTRVLLLFPLFHHVDVIAAYTMSQSEVPPDLQIQVFTVVVVKRQIGAMESRWYR